MRKINPSVKAIAILLCGLMISFSYSVFWNGVLIAVCLILTVISGANLRKMGLVLLPATLAAASIFMAFLLHGNGAGAQLSAGSRNFLQVSAGAGNLQDAVALALRIYAYAFLGMLFSFTTDSQEFLYSLMQQCRLAPKFAYGVLAAYHLIPMIHREYRQIRLAYEVRGLVLPPWSLRPVFTALVNAVHWAESLAMAMESKGFDENSPRTYYIYMKVRAVDVVWAVGMIVISLAPFIEIPVSL